MPTHGPTSPTAAASTPAGGIAWADPANALAADGAVAYFAGPGTSDDLDVTGFGFTIGGTPTGVTAEVRRRTEFQALDEDVYLLVGGVAVGPDKADLATFWPGALAYKVYTWTEAELAAAGVDAAAVNAAGFGLRFRASAGSLGPGSERAEVDHVRLTVEAPAVPVYVPGTWARCDAEPRVRRVTADPGGPEGELR